MSAVDASVENPLALFPLPLVALPGEYVPLHIFEPRYRTMVAQCLESGSEFGIVWLADDGLKPIGCAGAIGWRTDACTSSRAERGRSRCARDATTSPTPRATSTSSLTARSRPTR